MVAILPQCVNEGLSDAKTALVPVQAWCNKAKRVTYSNTITMLNNWLILASNKT